MDRTGCLCNTNAQLHIFLKKFLLNLSYCLQVGQRDLVLEKEIGLLIILSSPFRLTLPMLVMVGLSTVFLLSSQLSYSFLCWIALVWLCLVFSALINYCFSSLVGLQSTCKIYWGCCSNTFSYYNRLVSVSGFLMRYCYCFLFL